MGEDEKIFRSINGLLPPATRAMEGVKRIHTLYGEQEILTLAGQGFLNIPVRVVEINGEPWFCLADVCKVLEIDNPSQIKTRLKADGVITNEVTDKLGRQQMAVFITESRLYEVLMLSRKPIAKWTEYDKSSINKMIDTVDDDEKVRKNVTILGKIRNRSSSPNLACNAFSRGISPNGLGTETCP